MLTLFSPTGTIRNKNKTLVLPSFGVKLHVFPWTQSKFETLFVFFFRENFSKLVCNRMFSYSSRYLRTIYSQKWKNVIRHGKYSVKSIYLHFRSVRKRKKSLSLPLCNLTKYFLPFTVWKLRKYTHSFLAKISWK